PLTVIQMLWVNLIMDTFAALALATEPPQKSVMQKPPRHPESFIITPAMAENILIVGLIFLSILSFMIYTIQKNGINAQELTIFFTTFVMLQFWNMFNAKTLGRTESAFYGINQNKSFLLIAFVILLGQIGIVQFGGEQLFRTVPLDLKTWLIIIVATSPVLIVGEFIRWMMRIRDRRAKA
ncbi:MAG TPA: cation-translocating P-type ATPase C-terminal domain-containing protein, partial [Planctomycetota bacterium]|nr:cation-translocating P-type ATPase C-terminal domain-containing protein [Planctomycetota bacterium]